MQRQLFLTLLILTLSGCNIKTKKQSEDTSENITKLRKLQMEKNHSNLGKFLGIISFEVKTKDTVNFKNGLIHWANLEKPDHDVTNLKDANQILISQNIVTVIIDYPLKNEYRFELNSNRGFSRAILLKEISKAYHKMYEEEENTATIKTIPVEKRTTMYNRNETNGKYGIWGHDIADLVLSEIHIYENSDKKIILSLMIES